VHPESLSYFICLAHFITTWLTRTVHESSKLISWRVFVTYARSRSQNTNKLAHPWIIHRSYVHTAIRNSFVFFFLLCCTEDVRRTKSDSLPIDIQLNMSAFLTDICISYNWRGWWSPTSRWGISNGWIYPSFNAREE